MGHFLVRLDLDADGSHESKCGISHLCDRVDTQKVSICGIFKISNVQTITLNLFVTEGTMILSLCKRIILFREDTHVYSRLRHHNPAI